MGTRVYVECIEGEEGRELELKYIPVRYLCKARKYYLKLPFEEVKEILKVDESLAVLNKSLGGLSEEQYDVLNVIKYRSYVEPVFLGIRASKLSEKENYVEVEEPLKIVYKGQVRKAPTGWYGLLHVAEDFYVVTTLPVDIALKHACISILEATGFWSREREEMILEAVSPIPLILELLDLGISRITIKRYVEWYPLNVMFLKYKKTYRRYVVTNDSDCKVATELRRNIVDFFDEAVVVKRRHDVASAHVVDMYLEQPCALLRTADSVKVEILEGIDLGTSILIEVLHRAVS